MNFLAHLYLSGSNEKIMIGNFIGDFVKGKAFELYDKDIQRGILLHRHIDDFTDHHPIVTESKKRLREKYRHYAGVIVDMFYDHFLASNWADYHSITLDEYAKNIYGMLLSFQPQLPKGAKYMLPFMIEHNWLLNYANKTGIHNALAGMARRTKFVSHMEEAINDLSLHYSDFEGEFKAFFPDVEQFAKKWLQKS